MEVHESQLQKLSNLEVVHSCIATINIYVVSNVEKLV